jgi:hypothetical protein
MSALLEEHVGEPAHWHHALAAEHGAGSRPPLGDAGRRAGARPSLAAAEGRFTGNFETSASARPARLSPVWAIERCYNPGRGPVSQ